MSNKPLSVHQALAKANTLARKGAPDQAAQLYQAVLERFPGNKRAVEGLKSLPRRKPGRQQTAPDTGPIQEQISGLIALHQQGRTRAALERGTALAKRHPDVPQIHNILGIVNAVAGRPEAAVTSLTKALRIDPGYAEAHNNLGIVLSDLGKPGEAVACYSRALQLMPDYADAHYNLANALSELGRFEQAVTSYARALRQMPGLAEAHNGLANALSELGRYEQALASYANALRINPDYAKAHNNLGSVLTDLHKPEQAVASYTRALRIQPDYAEAHCNLGAALSELGQHRQAVASYDEALRIRPGYAKAYENLGRIKKYQADDPQIARMRDLVADRAIAENDKTLLSFALGKAYDDIGDAESAFPHFLEGNRLRKKQLGYDIGSDIRLFSLIKSVFSESKLPTPWEARPAEQKKQPIFITGMHRSGTTLTEQILASHSQVHGAGEIRVMDNIVKHLLIGNNDVCFEELTGDIIKRIRSGYLDELDRLGVDQPSITDKAPLNFRWIGFILTAMPEAKVINLQRDPVATCWSVFKQYFSSSEIEYAYDLVDIADYYKLYIDLMDFWREKFPNRIYDLDYEALTKNQEAGTRKLLEYCELDWEAQCLEFHQTKRAVRTPSSIQVRKSIYQGSSETWRKYEAQLRPMLRALAG